MTQLPHIPPALRHASYPGRDLELATYMAQLHGRTTHHLSASECETLALGGPAGAWPTPRTRRAGPPCKLGYTDPSGAPWLRAAAAAGYATARRRTTSSASPARRRRCTPPCTRLLAPGDHAIVVLPSYQSIETLAIGLCDVTGVALDAAHDWALDIDAVAAAVRPTTRVIAISFPNNPTGKQLESERFAALVALCRRHGIWLLSDEVYRLTERDPGRRLPAAADAYERGVSLGVLSKAYGLPGLRIGWVACRDRTLLGRVATIRQYLSTCSAGPSEVLACIALKAAPAIVGRNRALAEANLQALLGFFGRHPALFECVPPEGGMVCYPRYTGPGGVDGFVADMAQAGVLLLPASVFRSELMPLPTDRFRLGFGRASFTAGLAALEAALA